MNSNLTKFNHLYAELVGQLKATFPKMTKKLPNYSQYQERDFLKDFVLFNLPFMDTLSVGNVDVFLFKYKDAPLVSGLPFRRVLKHSPPALIEAVLNYLRDLYSLGHSTGLMLKLTRKINDKYIVERMSALDHHDAIMNNFLNIEEEEEVVLDDDDDESDDDDDAPGNILESLLGGMGGGGLAGLAGMMGGAGGPDLAGLAGMMGSGGPDLAGMMGGDPAAMFGNLENSEIGKLAKELFDGMGAEEMTQLNDIGRQGMQNPAALMGQLFGAVSGNGGDDNVIGNLVQRTVGNIQQKMDSGEINMDRMMTDVQGFLNVLDPTGANVPMPPGFAEAAQRAAAAQNDEGQDEAAVEEADAGQEEAAGQDEAAVEEADAGQEADAEEADADEGQEEE